MIPSVIGSIREAFSLADWVQWFEQLDRTFVFLLVLPFVVAIVGLWAAYRDRERDEAQAPAAARDRGRGEGAANLRQRDARRSFGNTPRNLTE
jgi:hypothetical protein